MTSPVRIAVFASGRGSNFMAIHQALVAMKNAPAVINLCISNNPRPGAFDYAEQQGIPAVRMSPKMFATEDEYERALMELLRSHGIEMIVLAGYMRKIPPAVVREFSGRILNIHPALLPDFGGSGMYGMNVHRAVIESGRDESGVSVHLVDSEYDTGPVIARERVPVLADDTPETLAERVLKAEHRLYPRVVIERAGAIAAERSAR